MQISRYFDESNEERRKRIYRREIATAEKLKNRLNHFIKNVERNHSLTKGQKGKIKGVIIKNLDL